MKKMIYFFVLFSLLASCEDWESEIRVVNELPGAIIRNVQWGSLPIASKLLQGETSTTIKLNEFSPYDIPEEYRLQFYIEVNGEKVYLETQKSYYLGKDEVLEIIISDTTEVFNPLLEKEK